MTCKQPRMVRRDSTNSNMGLPMNEINLKCWMYDSYQSMSTSVSNFGNLAGVRAVDQMCKNGPGR